MTGSARPAAWVRGSPDEFSRMRRQVEHRAGQDAEHEVARRPRRWSPAVSTEGRATEAVAVPGSTKNITTITRT